MLRLSPSTFQVRAVNDEESDDEDEQLGASKEASTKLLVELSGPGSLNVQRKKL